MSNLGFELWWAGGTTTLLTTQPQVGSLPIVTFELFNEHLFYICLFVFAVKLHELGKYNFYTT
jgi:hypothetical protein